MNPAPFIDHTLLKADATAEEIRTLCEEAVEQHFAAVCVPPVYVSLAAERLYGSEVATATVVGFPLGYACSAVKACETRLAVAQGADEIDMVIHLGAARAGDFDRVREDVAEVVRAAQSLPVKVILECACFDREVMRTLAQAALDAGAHTLKTSTGFGPGGATLEDVRLLAAVAAGRAGIKAAGGIRDWPTCRAFLAAGATRIGTSSGLTIMAQWRAQEGLLR